MVSVHHVRAEQGRGITSWVKKLDDCSDTECHHHQESLSICDICVTMSGVKVLCHGGKKTWDTWSVNNNDSDNVRVLAVLWYIINIRLDGSYRIIAVVTDLWAQLRQLSGVVAQPQPQVKPQHLTVTSVKVRLATELANRTWFNLQFNCDVFLFK